jgi:Protein of unknown function DUF58
MNTTTTPKLEHAGPRREGLEAARRFRLPFARQAWRGAAGGWQGAGAGSSIDFQDHRAYVPGDDPRHLHWAAYARTGQLTMKLYRAEVSPRVDLLVDISGSMRAEAPRAARTEALVFFCMESAALAGAPLRLHVIESGRARLLANERVRAEGFWSACGEARPSVGEGVADGRAVAGVWRSGAMKIWISDLLFAGEPGPALHAMAAGGGCALLFAPVLASEAELSERGNVELVNHEGAVGRRQRIDDALAERYRTAYARHFALWRDAARRAAVGFARVDCAEALAGALGEEARVQGLVEVAA